MNKHQKYLDKTKKRELAAEKINIAVSVLKNTNSPRNFAISILIPKIEKYYFPDFGRNSLTESRKQYLLDILVNKNRVKIFDLCRTCLVPNYERQDNIGVNISRAIIASLKYSSKFIKNPADFKPVSREYYSQLHEYLTFVFSKYPLPYCFIGEFIRENSGYGTVHYTKYVFEYIDGFGPEYWSAFNSVKLTKKMRHILLSCKFFDLIYALRYAQITAYGGSKALVDTVYYNWRGNDILTQNESFLAQILEYLSRQTMIDMKVIPNILDYLFYMKNSVQSVLTPAGYRDVPLYPNFSLKGRSLYVLMKDCEKWHDMLPDKTNKQANITWENLLNSDDLFVIKEKPSDTTTYDYKFTELLSSNALQQEGKAMRHCVASYANDCHQKECSIVSLTKNLIRIVTIEVRKNKIAQIRGKCNRMPTPLETQIIDIWAKKHNIERTFKTRNY